MANVRFLQFAVSLVQILLAVGQSTSLYECSTREPSCAKGISVSHLTGVMNRLQCARACASNCSCDVMSFCDDEAVCDLYQACPECASAVNVASKCANNQVSLTARIASTQRTCGPAAAATTAASTSTVTTTTTANQISTTAAATSTVSTATTTTTQPAATVTTTTIESPTPTTTTTQPTTTTPTTARVPALFTVTTTTAIATSPTTTPPTTTTQPPTTSTTTTQPPTTSTTTTQPPTTSTTTTQPPTTSTTTTQPPTTPTTTTQPPTTPTTTTQPPTTSTTTTQPPTTSTTTTQPPTTSTTTTQPPTTATTTTTSTTTTTTTVPTATNAQTTTPDYSTLSCEAGWSKFQASCFFFYTSMNDVPSHGGYCSWISGATLDVPNTAAENEFIKTLIATQPAGQDYWVGIYQDLGGEWKLNYGTTPPYTDWAVGAVFDPAIQCVKYDSSSGHQWMPTECTSPAAPHPYLLCERPAV